MTSTPNKCQACLSGFKSNYFFAANPTINYWNPYTCYKIGPGLADWPNANKKCEDMDTGVTAMIIRTTEEMDDALRFASFFAIPFWV